MINKNIQIRFLIKRSKSFDIKLNSRPSELGLMFIIKLLIYRKRLEDLVLFEIIMFSICLKQVSRFLLINNIVVIIPMFYILIKRVKSFFYLFM